MRDTTMRDRLTGMTLGPRLEMKEKRMSKVVYIPKGYRYQVQCSEDYGGWDVYETCKTLKEACDSADMHAKVLPSYQWRVVDTEED